MNIPDLRSALDSGRVVLYLARPGTHANFITLCCCCGRQLAPDVRSLEFTLRSAGENGQQVAVICPACQALLLRDGGGWVPYCT